MDWVSASSALEVIATLFGIPKRWAQERLDKQRAKDITEINKVINNFVAQHANELRGKQDKMDNVMSLLSNFPSLRSTLSNKLKKYKDEYDKAVAEGTEKQRALENQREEIVNKPAKEAGIVDAAMELVDPNSWKDRWNSTVKKVVDRFTGNKTTQDTNQLIEGGLEK